MRKLLFITAGFILAFGLISCEKKGGIPNNDKDWETAEVLKANVELGENAPDSESGVTPEVIAGKNNGGNRTCEEVWNWFVSDQTVWECGVDFVCGDRIDYDEGSGEFESDFPSGLTVNVHGIYVDFKVHDCVEIDGKYYKVGAVIVKGSNAANVYYYEGGTLEDKNLAAPGEKHMVSNLTFCFVPCVPETPKNYYAAKIWYKDATGTGRWAVSYGSDTDYFTGSTSWCRYTEFGAYPTEDMDLVDQAIKQGTENVVGSMTVDADGNIEFTLNVTDPQITIRRAFLYWGTMNDLGSVNTCPAYTTEWIAKNQLSSQFVEFINGTDFNVP